MLDKDNLKPVLESLIFAADSAISFEKLAGILEGEEKAIIREALGELIGRAVGDRSSPGGD
jgi:chromosome segregation and condensation protein ScpB